MFWDDVALGTAWEDVADVRVPRATLLVDTDSREARLVNTTEKDLDLTFYQITSESGALSDRTWESLADQGVEGWLENNPSGNSLTESRFEGSTSFADAARINLGRALRRRVEDLVARIGTADGLLNLMNVEYGEIIDPVMGDCNGDQVVDAADLTCICGSDTGTIADVLTATGLLAGDLDGDGTVAFPDFLVLSASFGQNVESYIAGDIDCDGQVAFADFLLLSANFGQSSGVMAAAVPEPSGLSLALLGLVSLWHWRPT